MIIGSRETLGLSSVKSKQSLPHRLSMKTTQSPMAGQSRYHMLPGVQFM